MSLYDPAHPTLHNIDGDWTKEPLPKYTGFSKLELAALMMGQAILSKPTLYYDTNLNEIESVYEDVAQCAKKHAKAILQECANEQ